MRRAQCGHPQKVLFRWIPVVLLVTACATGVDDQALEGDAVGRDVTVGLPDTVDEPGSDISKPDVDFREEVVDRPDVDEGEVKPPSLACDDGDPCTYGDRMVDGVCVGTPYTCDDGKDCTANVCDGLGGCKYNLKDGYCLVRGVCAEDGESPAWAPCLVCDVSAATDEWTERDGECDDGDPCTANNLCEAGVCVGEPVVCDDGNPCTTGWCDPAEGCVFTPNALSCDDGDACTVGDYCHDGECRSGAARLDCDDGNPCTSNDCDPAMGCLATDLPDGDECDDGDACTVGAFCLDGICQGALTKNCDDGNSCTFNWCDPISGCQAELDVDNPCCTSGTNPCDDGNPCTFNECNLEDGSCEDIPLDGEPCDDGNICTATGICDDDVCVPGPEVDCDDGNPCTFNWCDPERGCRSEPLDPGSPCEHPDECVVDAACVDGACVGERLSCVECPPPFYNPLNIATSLAIGTDGHPGSGLDVDGDPDTCAPAANCSAGVDNQFAQSLGILNSFIDVNQTLSEAVADGDVNILFEHRAPVFDGGAYELAVVIGERAQPACDPLVELCPYLVLDGSFVDDPPCEALIRFGDTRIEDGVLTAGGPGSRFGISLPFMEGVMLELTLYNARLEAQVTEEDGAVIAMAQGLIGGAIRRQDVVDLVNALPDEVFEDLPVTRELIVGLLPSVFVTDIDTTGDGDPDATSIGLEFEARAAQVTGVAP